MIKESTPKVSIIMGIYNCESTLEEAIQSIMNQTFTDWEMIMCDDGSKDNTYPIAKKYVEDYPDRFVLLRNKQNKGLNYTLNRCLDKAKGQYIARMDGDDLCDAKRLEKEVDFLDKHEEYALVSTEMAMFDEDGQWGKTTAIPYPVKKDFCRHTPFFCHAATMIRREVFLEVEGYTVDRRLLRVEDCHLWFKIYSRGYKGANILEPLYMMRDDRQASLRRNFKGRINYLYVLWVGFGLVHMPWYRYIYIVRSTLLEIIKWIIPIRLYEYIHRKRLKSN